MDFSQRIVSNQSLKGTKIFILNSILRKWPTIFTTDIKTKQLTNI